MALSATFGQDGKQLTGTKVFGQMIGSIARVFTAMSRAEPWVSRDGQKLERWTGYSESSFGRGFLNSTIKWLPELTNLYPSMEAYVNLAYSKAVRLFEEAAYTLADVCRCRNCDCEYGDSINFCLPVLAEAVIFLIWSLSSLQLESDIHPSRAGLESVYGLFTNDIKIP